MARISTDVSTIIDDDEIETCGKCLYISLTLNDIPATRLFLLRLVRIHEYGKLTRR